ncbi:MAG: site-2 protease family protein [Desulfurococcales archaeon]|nr:site-2 protease family protein [Desulfurococcales archaeon]
MYGAGGRRTFPGVLSVEVEEPVSWLLGIAALAFAWGGFSVLNPLFYITPSFIAILAGFVVHEMAHKMVAIRYGMKAGFVAFGPGILVTALSGLIPGLVVLVPGYVRVWGFGGFGRGILYSVASGPASNIVLASASLLLLLTGLHPGFLKPYLHSILSINAYLAFFNLLPIPPLDGSKIVREDLRLWAALMILSVVLLIFPA